MSSNLTASAKNTAILGCYDPVFKLVNAVVDVGCFCLITSRKLMAIEVMLGSDCIFDNQITVGNQPPGDALPQGKAGISI